MVTIDHKDFDRTACVYLCKQLIANIEDPAVNYHLGDHLEGGSYGYRRHYPSLH